MTKASKLRSKVSEWVQKIKCQFLHEYQLKSYNNLDVGSFDPPEQLYLSNERQFTLTKASKLRSEVTKRMQKKSEIGV